MNTYWRRSPELPLQTQSWGTIVDLSETTMWGSSKAVWQSLTWKLRQWPRLDLLQFNGNMHIEDFIDSISEVECLFDYIDISEARKVKLVVLQFRGTGWHWWDQTIMNRVKYHKALVRTWEKMKHLLQQRFLPADYERVLFDQFQYCRQGIWTLSEYTRKFHQLGSRNNLQESEEQFVTRFVGGLKDKWKNKLALQPQYSLMNAINVAEQLEM